MDTNDSNLKMAEITLAAIINYSVCPVCSDTLMSPIYQCCNGHIICSICVERIDKCVECRSPMSRNTKIRNIALEKVLHDLCVDCSNKNEGCEVKSTVGWLRNHLQVCPFTPFSLCSFLLGWKNCEYKVNDSSVISHLKRCHSITTVSSKTFRLCLNTSKIPGDGEDFYFEPLLVNSMDVPLLIRSVVSSDGYFTFTGIVLKNNLDDAQSIRLKFRVESQSRKDSFEWSGHVQSYRTFKETHSFRIPVDSLLEFLGLHESSSRDDTAIIIKVFVWEASALSQEDIIKEEVHIFEQSQFPRNTSNVGRAASVTPTPLTQTFDDENQSEDQGAEEYLNLFNSPFESNNSFRL